MNTRAKFTFALSSLFLAFSSVKFVNAADNVYFTSNVRLECESSDYATEECLVPTAIAGKIRSINLVKTYSNKACIEGDTLEYGFIPSGRIITVTDGCRAQFNLELDEPVPVVDVLCENSGGSYDKCYSPVGVGSFKNDDILWIKDRKSTSSCNRDEDFSIYQGALEVRNGCRALFSFYPEDGWQ